MGDLNWKAIGLGALDLLLLIILTVVLAHSVTHHCWIRAQISLLGILLLLGFASWQIRRLLLSRQPQKGVAPPNLGITTIIKLVQFTACGLAAIVIYAIQYNHWQSASVANTVGVGLLTAGGSLAAGAFLGFLFGVPKSLAAPAGPSSGSAIAAGTAGEEQFVANTNLEQISDWLTKTIVGVSLVELAKLPPLLDKLASYVATGMGHEAKAVALVIIVYFFSSGFLISYLWTRITLQRVFSESTLSQRVTELENQSAEDAKAIATVDRWLNHHPALQDEDKARSEMADAIRCASSLVKARVFVTAEDFKRNTPTARIRDASGITLPVFQALVDADGEQIFHRNRGQYAIALMTQSKPDFAKALTVIEDAIQIRDRAKDPSWPEYEFARAVCKIQLDPQASSKPEVKSAIDADLKKANDLNLEQDKRDRIDLDKVAAKWQP